MTILQILLPTSWLLGLVLLFSFPGPVGTSGEGWFAFLSLLVPLLYWNFATGFFLSIFAERLGGRYLDGVQIGKLQYRAFFDVSFVRSVWKFDPKSNLEKRMQLTFIFAHTVSAASGLFLICISVKRAFL